MSTQVQSRHIKDATAKAWVRFNGTGTIVIEAAYNVSSITDNGTGNYTVNFSTPFSDSLYAMVGTGQAFDDTPSISPYPEASPFSASSAHVVASKDNGDSSGGVPWDMAFASVVFFR